MATYADVLASNQSLHQSGSGLCAVFVGATAGIGLSALRSLTRNTDSPTIYIVGRSVSRLQSLISELEQLNKTATFHPIVAADLTLVASADAAAREIAAKADRVDLLIMSCGYIDFSRHESVEGLDKLTAIRYYSRMRLLVTLAPLLQASPSPRVVSVLGGGGEGEIWRDDLLLEKHYGVVNAAVVSGTMTTLFLEEFSKTNGMEKVVFVHIYPGLVGDTAATVSSGISWWAKPLIQWVVAPLMRLIGYSSAEAGERVIFAATNGRFRRLEKGKSGDGTLIQKGLDGSVGSGVYLVIQDSSAVTQNTVLKRLREEGMGDVIMQHTMEVFEKVAKL